MHEYGVSSSVAPSGLAALTTSQAMRPAAPVLFSTTAPFFVYAVPPSLSPMRRLVASAVPPAGKPLMILTCSNDCANAGVGSAPAAPSEAIAWTKWRRVVVMPCLLAVREPSSLLRRGAPRTPGSREGADAWHGGRLHACLRAAPR